jgi:acyl-CoA reductase-like NAD-dependent aldehyde dehydrogenase
MHLGNCIEIYRYFAAAIRAHEDRVVQYDNGNISIVLREPLGVVGLILPWNAPSMLLAWKLAPALAAGNAVVVKPASSASLVPINLVEKFQAALPPGVLNLVTGSGPKVGTPLADHPGISKISFTGSVEAGRILGAKASQNIIPVTLELGGKSASIIFEDSHVDRALQFAVLASVSSAGAICVSSSRILVQDTIYDSFVAKIKEKYDALATTAGNPLDPASGVAPIIDKTQYERIIGYIESGISEGAKLVSGGKRITGGICDKGYYMEPTLFANVTKDMTIAKEEIFGSVLSIMRFSTEEEAIEIANSTQYGLASAVWTKDIYKATRVSRALQAGIVWVNDYMDISAGGPFGGYKKSGFGREINKMAIDYYSNTKNINISSDETTPQMF